MSTIIGDLPRINASRQPDGLAIVSGSRRVSWAELEERSNRLARALTEEFGLQAGDTVAILAQNCLEYVEVMFAASKAGVTWTGLNTRHHISEMEHQLRDSNAGVLIHQAGPLSEVATDLADRTGQQLVALGEEYETLLSRMSAVPVPSHGDADLPYALTYTSGTTGVARGALISSRNDLALAASFVFVTETRVDDVFMVMLPMFHKGGQFATLHPMNLGRPLVILPSPEPEAAFAAIEAEGVSIFVGVPTVMRMFVEHRHTPAGAVHDLSTIRHVTYGSNPIPPAQIREFAETFSCELSQIGGIGTEGGIGLSLSSRDHALAIADPSYEHILTSCGRVQPGAEMRLVDESGNDVATGQIGEMVFRGDAYIAGYINQPEANAKLWQDGWLHSGDLGRRDEEGYVYYVERLGGRIKTGGETVLAREVEAALASHPAVVMASVLGVPDERWGERICAVVMTESEGSDELAQELQDHVRGQLAGYKVPREIRFVREMPLTALGKIARGQVRLLAQEAATTPEGAHT